MSDVAEKVAHRLVRYAAVVAVVFPGVLLAACSHDEPPPPQPVVAPAPPPPAPAPPPPPPAPRGERG